MLTIDPRSPEPPYEQVRRQLAEQIELGDLPAGTKLPPVRRLADDLGLAPNTVARTYRELESAGLVVTSGRNGTQVVDHRRAADPHPGALRLATRYLSDMRRLGFDLDASAAYLRQAIEAGHS